MMGETMLLPEPLKGIRTLAFYGDSLTDGSDYPDIVVNTLNRTYPGYGFRQVNAALAGETASGLVERLDRDILSSKPDLTFILIGTNDSNNRNPPIQYRADLMYLARRLKTAGSRVAFITLTGSTDAEKADHLKAYDTIIRELAVDAQTMLVDAWAFFEQRQAAGEDLYFAPGDVHHSLAGFHAMARVILNTLGVPGDVPMVTAITPPAGVLTQWEESGPVTRPDAAHGSVTPDQVTEWTPYDFTAWIDEKDWSWRPLAQRGAWFALQGEAKSRTAFARTTYRAAAAGLHELQLGGTAPLRVWVNGTLVFTLPKTNGHHPNAVRTPVLLDKGDNEIVLTTPFYAFAGVYPPPPAAVPTPPFMMIHTESVVYGDQKARRLTFRSGFDGATDWALFVPGDPALNLVVFLHGSFSNADQIFVRPDVRDHWLPRTVGRGHPLLSINMRNTSYMSPAATRDLLDLLAWCRARGDAREVVLLGGSGGASSAMAFAAVHPEQINGVVAMGMCDIFSRLAFARESVNPLLNELARVTAQSYGGCPDVRPGLYTARSVLANAHRMLDLPIVLAMGEADPLIPVEETRKIAAALQANPRFQYIEIPGGGHDAPLTIDIDLQTFSVR